MTEREDDALARNRFIALTACRVIAALMVMFGIVIAQGKLDWVGADLAAPLGYGLVIIGFVDLLFIVPMLARKWRSPQD